MQMEIQLMRHNMKKLKRNNQIKLMYQFFLVISSTLYVSCTSNSKTDNQQLSKAIIWSLDSCYFIKVSENSKCINCESSLEFFVNINNNMDSDISIYNYNGEDSVNKKVHAFKINYNKLSFDCKHEITDSIIIKKAISFNLVIQPDIYMIQFKDFTKEKYDEYLKKMAETSEIVYKKSGTVITIKKSPTYKVIDRLH